MQLTRNFSLEELIHSQVAARLGIDNAPQEPDILDNLRQLANTLQYLRDVVGAPLVVSSGYRCPEVNLRVGGSATSAHLAGLAADVTCPALGPPVNLARQIVTTPAFRFDQVILEYREWVHISVDARLRQQILTIDRSGKRTGLHP